MPHNLIETRARIYIGIFPINPLGTISGWRFPLITGARDGNPNGLAISVNHGRVTRYRRGNARKMGEWKLIGQNKIAYNLCCSMLLHFEKRCLIRTPRSELFSVLIMNKTQASDLGLLLCCLLNAIFGKGIYIKHYMLLYLSARFFPYSGFSKIFSNKIQISL